MALKWASFVKNASALLTTLEMRVCTRPWYLSKAYYYAEMLGKYTQCERDRDKQYPLRHNVMLRQMWYHIKAKPNQRCGRFATSSTLDLLDLVALTLRHSIESFHIVHITNDSATSLIMVTDLGITETVQFLRADSVEIDREDERNEEASQRHAHGVVVGVHMVSGKTSQGWEEGATTD